MTKGELAKKYFLEGFNCAQSVALAFCDDFGTDKETMLLISSPFGGGMGRLREVCGAVSGMLMALGLANGYSNPGAKEEKAQLYKDVQSLAEKFRQDNGSIICRELLDLRKAGGDNPVPSDRTPEYYASRPCPELCRYAADLIDDFLAQKAFNT